MKDNINSRFLSRLLTIFVTILLCMAATSCGAGEFDGEIISDSDRFLLDYRAFDCSKRASLTLEEGDSLRVVIDNADGEVDLSVGIEGQDPVYEGKSLRTFSFTISISAHGSYLIEVIGHDARGSVSVIKSPKSRAE